MTRQIMLAFLSPPLNQKQLRWTSFDVFQQEGHSLGPEISTLGSLAGTVSMSKTVVLLKALKDRLRFQYRSN